MGEAYYFSLSFIKIKRSEPNISNITLESPQKKITSIWPVALLVVVLAIASFIGKRRQQSSSIDKEKIARLNALRKRIMEIGDRENV